MAYITYDDFEIPLVEWDECYGVENGTGFEHALIELKGKMLNDIVGLYNDWAEYECSFGFVPLGTSGDVDAKPINLHNTLYDFLSKEYQPHIEEQPYETYQTMFSGEEEITEWIATWLKSTYLPEREINRLIDLRNKQEHNPNDYVGKQRCEFFRTNLAEVKVSLSVSNLDNTGEQETIEMYFCDCEYGSMVKSMCGNFYK